jgi:hypothetical protein
MDLIISGENLLVLAKNIAKKENKKDCDEPLRISVGRVIFIEWMKKRGMWEGYKKSLIGCPMYYQEAWVKPPSIISFLGACSFDFTNAYLPWKKYCYEYLLPLMKKYNI